MTLPKASIKSSLPERFFSTLRAIDMNKILTHPIFWVVLAILVVFGGGYKACMCNLEHNTAIVNDNMELGKSLLKQQGWADKSITCIRSNTGVRDVSDITASGCDRDPFQDPDAICYAGADGKSVSVFCVEGRCDFR